MKNNQSFDSLLEKINKAKVASGVDLSTDEDLSIAVMNLISLEEHFFFTGEKTGKPEYFDLLNEVREMRKSLLEKLMKHNEGETWCISKHLLSTTMRLMEVGTKLQKDGKNGEAKDMFDKAYKIYSLFWALKLKLVDASTIKKVENDGKPWTVEDLVTKLVNCCNE